MGNNNLSTVLPSPLRVSSQMEEQHTLRRVALLYCLRFAVSVQQTIAKPLKLHSLELVSMEVNRWASNLRR